MSKDDQDSDKKRSKEEKALDKAAAIEIKRFIKSQMALTGLSYKDLAEQMTNAGRPISEQSLRNKVSKSSHRTTWYWDLMKVIGSNK